MEKKDFSKLARTIFSLLFNICAPILRPVEISNGLIPAILWMYTTKMNEEKKSKLTGSTQMRLS